MTKEEREAKAIYDKVADFYHDYRTKKYPKGWFFNELLEMPTTLNLLGDLKGKKVLDFGCGTGIYAKLMTKKGAKVKGFDISNKMLEIARKENPKLVFKQGSGNKIPFDEKFDIVVAPLVIDYLPDWDKVFREVSRVLKKGGVFIFSVGNPFAGCTKPVRPKRAGFIREFKYNYFKSANIPGTWDRNGEEIKIYHHHKSYETIIKTILKNGFEIIDYRDVLPVKAAKKLFPDHYKKYTHFPTFCAWKLKKK